MSARPANAASAPGFPSLYVRTRLGEGEKVFRRAAEAVLTWELHREMGIGIKATAEKAAPAWT